MAWPTRRRSAVTLFGSEGVAVGLPPPAGEGGGGGPYFSGPGIGSNLGWWVYWDEGGTLADAARVAVWIADGTGSDFLRVDEDGWPRTNFHITLGAFTTGTYKLSFTGQATVNGGAITVTWDHDTNRSTADVVVNSAGTLTLYFTETKRLDTDTPPTGVTNLKLMRPGLPEDDGTAANRFDPDFVDAVGEWRWFRAMQCFGDAYNGRGVQGNTDVYWNEADATSESTPDRQDNTTYTFGQCVKSDGKTYSCVIPFVESGEQPLTGTCGTSAPQHGRKGGYGYSNGMFVDGGVYWGLATRVKPRGCANSYGGPAWEDIILLANASGTAPWFTIPYFAQIKPPGQACYVRKLAQLIKYGSDANGDPYTSPQASPVHAPLRSDLPFIVEWSNEIWNASSPYPGKYNNHFADDEFAGSNPWHYGPDSWMASWCRVARLCVTMSLVFRDVFGSEMMTRCRPIYAGRLVDAQWGLAPVLDYINDVWGPGSSYDTINGWTNPKQPVSYYLYGVAHAPYLNPPGAPFTPDAFFTKWNNDVAAIIPQMQAWDDYADTYGIKTLAYEGDLQTGAANASQTAAQQDTRYRQALKDLIHAFWNTTHGTADAYAHYRSLSSGDNMSLGYPNTDYAAGWHTTIVDRNTPAWDAIRDLRSEH